MKVKKPMYCMEKIRWLKGHRTDHRRMIKLLRSYCKMIRQRIIAPMAIWVVIRVSIWQSDIHKKKIKPLKTWLRNMNVKDPQIEDQAVDDQQIKHLITKFIPGLVFEYNLFRTESNRTKILFLDKSKISNRTRNELLGYCPPLLPLVSCTRKIEHKEDKINMNVDLIEIQNMLVWGKERYLASWLLLCCRNNETTKSNDIL